jgi:hypothetical protein
MLDLQLLFFLFQKAMPLEGHDSLGKHMHGLSSTPHHEPALGRAIYSLFHCGSKRMSKYSVSVPCLRGRCRGHFAWTIAHIGVGCYYHPSLNRSLSPVVPSLQSIPSWQVPVLHLVFICKPVTLLFVGDIMLIVMLNESNGSRSCLPISSPPDWLV